MGRRRGFVRRRVRAAASGVLRRPTGSCSGARDTPSNGFVRRRLVCPGVESLPAGFGARVREAARAFVRRRGRGFVRRRAAFREAAHGFVRRRAAFREAAFGLREAARGFVCGSRGPFINCRIGGGERRNGVSRPFSAKVSLGFSGRFGASLAGSTQSVLVFSSRLRGCLGGSFAFVGRPAKLGGRDLSDQCVFACMSSEGSEFA